MIPFFDLRRQYEFLRTELEPVVAEVLSSCAYIGGGYVETFERAVEKYLGVKNAIGCGNGTDALVLALKACNVRAGDEVITTSFSFFATAEAIAQIGAKPVFADIREEDYNIDPNCIERLITNRTKAIIPVHIFGAPCDMDAINGIAQKNGLYVIEDAAQAFGSKYHGRKAGTLGDLGCFSFYPTKNLGGVGDGGMIVTDNDRLAVNLRALREHGAGEMGARALYNIEGIEEIFSTNEEKTELYDPYKYYNYLVAYNSRLDAIQAAVLGVKLKRLDNFNEKRTLIASRYMEELSDVYGKPKYSDDIQACFHQFAITSDRKIELCRHLQQRQIGCGTFYPIPLHKQKAFLKSVGCNQTLPIAESVCAKTVCLPIFPELMEEEIDVIIETVNSFGGL